MLVANPEAMAAPSMLAEKAKQTFAQFLHVLDRASQATVADWNTPTYSTAKRWAEYMQRTVSCFASASDIAALDLVLAEMSREQGFKQELRCSALTSAPSLLLRTLLLNRYTPDKLMPAIWNDLATAQPPPACAALDGRGNSASGADVLREELARARRLDTQLSAAEAICAALDEAASAIGHAQMRHALSADGDALRLPGGARLPLTGYRSAQMVVSARLMHAELCSRFGSADELDAFVRTRVLPYVLSDGSCLELFCSMLLVAPPPAAARAQPDAAARGAQTVEQAVVAERLEALLLETVLGAQARPLVWQLHPWLVAELSERQCALCVAYCSHLVSATADALRRVCAGLAAAHQVRSADAAAPEPAADEQLAALSRRWSQLLLRGGVVEAFCRQLLAELRRACSAECRSVLEATMPCAVAS